MRQHGRARGCGCESDRRDDVWQPVRTVQVDERADPAEPKHDHEVHERLGRHKPRDREHDRTEPPSPEVPTPLLPHGSHSIAFIGGA